MNDTNKSVNAQLPKGFESGASGEAHFKSAEQKNEQQFNVIRRGPRNYGQAVEKPKEAKKTLARLMKYFGSEMLLLIFLVASVLILTVASVIAPSLQGEGIDLIIDRDFNAISVLLIWLMIVYVIHGLCTLAQTLLSAHLSQRIVKKMRYDLFKKIDNLSIKYLDTHSNGDIMSRMTNDVENISMTVSQSLGSLVSGVLTIIGTVAIMFYYCWQLTLITMVSVILTVIVTRALSKIMRKMFRIRSKTLGDRKSVV